MAFQIKKFEGLGVEIADKVSKFVGTWTFIFIYTTAMLLWIGLHISGILHIDSPDFIKWNLWLSYFAGTQASIVLMSSARQAQIDRINDEKNKKIQLEQAKINTLRISQLIHQVDLLEEILSELTDDKKKDT